MGLHFQNSLQTPANFDEQNEPNKAQNLLVENQTKIIQGSLLIIIDRSHKFLLLKRGSTAPRSPNKWCHAGGHKNRNENPQNTAIRETMEETGLLFSAESVDKLFAWNWTKLLDKSSFEISVFFTMVDEINPIKVTLSSEHSDLAKVDLFMDKTPSLSELNQTYPLAGEITGEIIRCLQHNWEELLEKRRQNS